MALANAANDSELHAFADDPDADAALLAKFADEFEESAPPSEVERPSTPSSVQLSPAATALDLIAACEDEWFTKVPPPRTWLLRDERAGGAGVLPLGKVGALLAGGGIGKTMVAAQLCLSVASHDERNTWLGCFSVPNQGRALLVLGEEDKEEAVRRLYNARRATGAQIPEPGSIVVLPLAGVACAMLESDERGNLTETSFLRALRAFVESHGPFQTIVIDPHSRFGGVDAETDNAAATRAVQAYESLAAMTGATVLVVHHTNKTARAMGSGMSDASSRGSSAFTDGVRWVASLSAERVESDDEEVSQRLGELVTFSVVKSNYSRKGDSVTLRRDNDNGGALLPLTAADRELLAQARQAADPGARRREARAADRAEREAAEEARKQAKIDSDAREREQRLAAIDAALVAVLSESPGLGSRDLRAAMAARLDGCSAEAVADALARAFVVREPGPGKAVRHFLVGPLKRTP